MNAPSGELRLDFQFGIRLTRIPILEYKVSGMSEESRGIFYKKTLFDAAAVEEIQQRMTQLKADSARQWGSMTAAQALAHCSTQMEVVIGMRSLPRSFAGRVFGPIAKRRLLSEKPMPRNMPTDRHLIVADERDLDAERQRLQSLIDRFIAGGPEGCTRQPHSFLGPMAPDEWALLMYKHLDHHLQQFGV